MLIFIQLHPRYILAIEHIWSIVWYRFLGYENISSNYPYSDALIYKDNHIILIAITDDISKFYHRFYNFGSSPCKENDPFIRSCKQLCQEKSLPTHFLLSIGLRINKYSISKMSKYKFKQYNAPNEDASFYFFLELLHEFHITYCWN